MLIRVVLACLLLFSSLAAQQSNPSASSPKQEAAPAQTTKMDPVKAADIRRFLAVTQVDKVAQQMMQQMTANIKPLITASLPPGEYREKLVELFLARFQSKAKPDDIIELVVPLYDKYFTDEEIKGLTKFYESPLGQKAVSTLPELVAETQSVGREWGGRLGRESMQEVLAEHPELKESMEAAATKMKMNTP